MRRRLLLASFGLLSISTAIASAPCKASEKSAGEAEQRYRQGLDAVKRWDFEVARTRMLEAYALEPKPKYLWGLAISEVKSNHPLEALVHFRQYLALPEATPEDREQARPLMAQADARTGHIAIAAPAGSVISVDGERLSIYDAKTIDVRAGRHTIERQGPDGAIASQVIDATEGQTVEVHFESVRPGAVVAEAGAAPRGPFASPQRPASEGEAAKTSVTRWVVPGGLVAAGAVGFALGGLYLAKAGDEQTNESQAHVQVEHHGGFCPQPPTSPPCLAESTAAHALASDRNAATAFLVGGSALVLGGAVVWLFWPKPRPAAARAAWSIAPTWGPAGAGVHWTGSF